jgi:hypothetical protein
MEKERLSTKIELVQADDQKLPLPELKSGQTALTIDETQKNKHGHLHKFPLLVALCSAYIFCFVWCFTAQFASLTDYYSQKIFEGKFIVLNQLLHTANSGGVLGIFGALFSVCVFLLLTERKVKWQTSFAASIVATLLVSFVYGVVSTQLFTLKFTDFQEYVSCLMNMSLGLISNFCFNSVTGATVALLFFCSSERTVSKSQN